MHQVGKRTVPAPAVPVSVMFATASRSATEQEDASGWQGTAEGRLPGSRNVRYTNCDANAEAPDTVKCRRGLLVLTPR
jgi:hypothetical protein